MAESNVVAAVLNAEEEVAPVLYLPDGQRLVFPGCHAKHVSAAEIETYEGRFEYWHGPTETLIVSDADARIVSGDHELPAQYLAQLAQQLADECGAQLGTAGPEGTPRLWRHRAEGRRQGHAEGERALLCRLAARRFGDEVAASLGVLLAGLASEDLADVGDWIFECTSDELLRRVRERH